MGQSRPGLQGVLPSPASLTNADGDRGEKRSARGPAIGLMEITTSPKEVPSLKKRLGVLLCMWQIFLFVVASFAVTH